MIGADLLGSILPGQYVVPYPLNQGSGVGSRDLMLRVTSARVAAAVNARRESAARPDDWLNMSGQSRLGLESGQGEDFGGICTQHYAPRTPVALLFGVGSTTTYVELVHEIFSQSSGTRDLSIASSSLLNKVANSTR